MCLILGIKHWQSSTGPRDGDLNPESCLLVKYSTTELNFRSLNSFLSLVYCREMTGFISRRDGEECELSEIRWKLGALYLSITKCVSGTFK